MKPKKTSETSELNHRLGRLVDHYCGGNQRQFALKVGINPSTLHSFLPKAEGKVTEPSADSIQKIAQALDDLNLSWLLAGRGEMLILPGRNPELEDAQRQIEEKDNLIDALMDEVQRLRHRSRTPELPRPAAALGKFKHVLPGRTLPPNFLYAGFLGASVGARVIGEA